MLVVMLSSFSEREQSMKSQKEGVYLVLDVGGTQIKGCMLDETGHPCGEIGSYPSHSRESAENILDHFACILKDLMKQSPNRAVCGVGMAFPGPFDYGHGISRMQNLDKYDSIFGLAIEPELKKRVLELVHAEFSFLHDVEAFALGEGWFGKLRKARSIVCLCIGTGAGSAFLKDKVPVKTGDGVPENGWIYHLPYRDSIIDDYLSVRGLSKISQAVYGSCVSGKELSELAGRKDKKAIRVWSRFGKDVRDAMVPVLDGFMPEAVILGGQIAKAFPFFGSGLAEECKRRNIKLQIETETSEKVIQGMFVKMTEG